MYRTLNTHYKEKFGCKVYKLAIDAGFTCPNRDGTAGSAGCIFCSAYGGGEFAEGSCESVQAQLEKAKARVSAKTRAANTLLIFSPFPIPMETLPICGGCIWKPLHRRRSWALPSAPVRTA